MATNKIEESIIQLWHNDAPNYQGSVLTFHWHYNNALPPEAYCARYTKQTIYVEAFDAKSALYAAHQIHLAAKGGYLAKSLGMHQPRFSLRPLWLGCELLLPVYVDFCVAVPHAWSECTVVTEVCQDVLRWGYNAIVLGVSQHFPTTLHKKEGSSNGLLAKIIAEIKSWGIAIVISAQQTGTELFTQDLLQKAVAKQYKTTLMHLAKMLPDQSYFLWHGVGGIEFRKTQGYETITEAELTLQQSHALLQILPSSLQPIYYLPYHSVELTQQQAAFVPQLLLELPPKIIVCFFMSNVSSNR